MSDPYVTEVKGRPGSDRIAGAGRRRSRRLAVVAVLIVVGLVVVGGVVAWTSAIYRPRMLSSGADGPTYDMVLTAVNSRLSALTGGPWTIFGAIGVASPSPFQPASLGWADSANATSACRTALPGITVWNGSMPIFDGSFASGTAPFWQLMFFSNASSEIVVATDLSGRVTVFTPLAMSSPCGQALEARGPLWGWAEYDLSTITVDSSSLAEAAWRAIGSSWVPSHPPEVEMYVFGDNDWPLWPGGILVALQRCGLVGAGGPQPTVFADINGNGSLNNYVAGLETCTPEANITANLTGTPVPYVNEFSNGTVTTVGATTDASQELQSTYGFGPHPSIAGYGLVAWMVGMTLADSSGQILRSAPASCSSWVASVDACEANATGWYAVLSTQSGSWLDSFPSGGNASAWVTPAGAILGDETLTIVVPSSWNVSGDILTTSGTDSQVPVKGSVTLV